MLIKAALEILTFRQVQLYLAVLICFFLYCSSFNTLASDGSKPAEIMIAAASNFAPPLTDLAKRYEQQSGDKVILAFGSSGKHFAQISNGAPFDLFYSADTERPKLLEDKGIAVSGSRYTYAIGHIVLWSPTPGMIDSDGKILVEGNFRHIAIANPKLAPYGFAASEFLEKKGLLNKLAPRMVRGENIAQTFQFVKSANAELGFIALSQVKMPGQQIPGSWWEIPHSLYTPIEQQAVMLKDNKASRAFLAFMKSTEARQVIQDYGYSIPGK